MTVFQTLLGEQLLSHVERRVPFLLIAQCRALAINGLSLALGIFANVSLLLTFLRRVSYHVSQPFTVIAWLTSAALLIALVIAYIHTPLNPKNLENVTWSQSYYYAIISATLYLFISLLLIGNLWGAYVQAHYPPGLPGLTAPQRSLMIQSILYMCYLGAGAALFGHLEGWRFLDAIYWADYTLLTVGIGSDFSPKTTAGRIAIVPYAWGGIITVGLVIAGVRALVIEKGKGKLRLRTVRRGKAVVARAVRKRWAPHTKNGEQGVENVLQRNDGEEQEHGKNDVRDEAISRDFNREVAGVRSKAKKKTEWVGLASAFAAYLLLWLGGAAAFFAFEVSHTLLSHVMSKHILKFLVQSAQKWTYGDALYFTNIALLTIGYGDLYPQSQAGKPFFVVWSLLAVPTVTVLISSLQDTLLSGLRGFMERLGRKKDIGPPDEDALSEEEKGLEDEGECEPGPGRSDTRSYNRGHDDEGIKEK